MAVAAPKRGELWWVNFDFLSRTDPQQGPGRPREDHEQAGRRPALVLSHDAYNARTGLMICLPVTSRPKGYRTELPLPPELNTQGVILTSHVYTIDWKARQASFKESAPLALAEQAADMLAALISGG